MRCPSCDYPLWGIRPGPCPECGRPFRSDEFEFAPGSVAFRCGACGQEYYGTDPKGLLLPREFACVRCGGGCVCGEMVVEPTERIDPLAAREVLPWLDARRLADGRRRQCRFGSFFATIWWFTARGWSAARGVPLDSPNGAAWSIAVLVAVLLGLVTSVPMLLPLVGFMVAPPAGGPAPAAPWAMLMGVAGFVVAGVSLGWMGFWTWTGLVAHAILRGTGGTRAGLGRSMQAVLYPSVIGVWGAIPLCCIGPLGSLIWGVVLACGSVREMQQVSWRRACLAVLPPATVGLIVVPLIFFLVVGGLSSRRVLAVPPPPPPPVVAPADSSGEQASSAEDETGSAPIPEDSDEDDANETPSTGDDPSDHPHDPAEATP